MPPPVAWKARKPWRPVQLSASLRMRSSTRSTISLPIVVAARVVVGRVLLARDDLLGVEELAVRARADLVADRRLEVDVTARGTCLPAPVSEKNVLKASSPPPMVLSEGIWPSGWMPCSRQKSSQQALPPWRPAWPM